MSGVVVVLCGIPGVGKGTVGRVLAQEIGATFVENHAVNELVFSVAGVHPGGHVPDGAFAWTARMQAAVREMVEEIAPRGASFVFTHTAYDHPAAWEAVDDFRRTAAAIGSRFLTVTLACDRTTLAGRISTPERRDRLKLVDVDVAWGEFADHMIPFRGAHRILDTTDLSPARAAALVADMAALARHEAPPREWSPEAGDDDPGAAPAP